MVRINIAMEGVATQDGSSISIAQDAITLSGDFVPVYRGHSDPIGKATDLRRSADGTLSVEFTPYISEELLDWADYNPAVEIGSCTWASQDVVRVLSSGELRSLFLEPLAYLSIAGVHPLAPEVSESARNVAWPDMPTLAVE